MKTKKFKFYFLWLCLICLGAFILQIIIPGFTEFFDLNINAIYGRQYWRFLTAIFLHGSLMHLIYNLFALFFFGLSLERIIESRRFLIVFLGSGITANLIGVNFYPESLGASGAIYGVIGCLTVLAPLMFIWAFGMIMPMFVAAFIWVIGDIIGVFNPSDVGNIAHLSGVALGLLMGFLFRLLNPKKIREARRRLVFPETYMRDWEDRYVK